MDNQYTKGELLQVHTKNYEVVEGRFHSMAKDKSVITLSSVKVEPGAEPSETSFHYYEPEIRNIVRLKEQGEQTYLKISEREYEDMIKTSKKYTYINQVDRTFHEAMDDIHHYNYIAISTDGANMGRKCKLPFLVLSTPQQVYIFDIQVLQYHAFDAGLKKILESESPKKIVHDCRNLSDCLYHKHNVKLNSVFDTQVGDLIISKNKTSRFPKRVKTLAECLNSYLGMKPNIIEEKLDLVQCTERPLAPAIKESLAKNICFLHRLSEVINDQMMLPFTRGVECYIETLRSKDDFKAWELCGKQNQISEDFKSATDY